MLASLMRRSKMFSMVSICHWVFLRFKKFRACGIQGRIIHFVEESYDVMFSRKEFSHRQFDSFKANDSISEPCKSN